MRVCVVSSATSVMHDVPSLSHSHFLHINIHTCHMHISHHIIHHSVHLSSHQNFSSLKPIHHSPTRTPQTQITAHNTNHSHRARIRSAPHACMHMCSASVSISSLSQLNDQHSGAQLSPRNGSYISYRWLRYCVCVFICFKINPRVSSCVTLTK